jgi:hypothetical protein
MPPIDIETLLAEKKGLLLDISFGGTPQERSVTYGPTGDIGRDPTSLPFALPDNTVNTAVVTHVLEFISPWLFFRWFDDLHRIMQPNGVVYFSGPYGGDDSQGWVSDPTHTTRVVLETFHWFDPATPFYEVHQKQMGRKTPKPWKILTAARVPAPFGTISYNVAMQAVKESR